MKSSRYRKIIMSSLIVVAITAGNVVLAHAATGDIINTRNGMKYNFSQPNSIKALIADIKDGGNDVFLKEDKDGRYYDPVARLKAEQDEVLARVKAGNNGTLPNVAAIKEYIIANAPAIIAAVKDKTSETYVPRQIVETTSYTNINTLGPVLSASPFGELDKTKRTISVTVDPNGSVTVPMAGTLSFEGTTNTLENTYFTVKHSDGRISTTFNKLVGTTVKTVMDGLKDTVYTGATAILNNKDMIIVSDKDGNSSVYMLKVN